VIRFVESAEKLAQVRGHGRWFPRQQSAQPVSYFVTNCLIVLWFKVHSSHSQALPLQQQQPLDPVFSLCKEFMADSQFPRAYEIGKPGPSSKTRRAACGIWPSCGEVIGCSFGSIDARRPDANELASQRPEDAAHPIARTKLPTVAAAARGPPALFSPPL